MFPPLKAKLPPFLLFGLVLLTLFVAALGPAPASAQKRVYLALDDHTDYFWTANDVTYRQTFRDTINYYMNLFRQDETNGVAPRLQNKFNLDGSFWAWEYLNDPAVTAAQRTEFINRIKDGHFSIPLTPLVLCMGAMPAEALIRGMYFGGQLERRYNFRIPLAVAMENQTFPYGVGAVWAGAGAKYSWRGVCGCATGVSPQHNTPEMYWLTGNDGSRVLMKWYRFVDAVGIGGYGEARTASTAVSFADTNIPFNVLGIFGKGGDDLATMISNWPATVQGLTTASRSVIVSNETDFFQDFEQTYGASLPSYGASTGNEWDVYSASMSELSASVKRYLEQLRAAEAMASLAAVKSPGFMSGRETARDLANINFGNYFEHDWTCDGPISRNARRDWQRSLVTGIRNYVTTLYQDAVSTLGQMIQKSGSAPRYFVFNPLGWQRTDFADLPYSAAGPVLVIDLTTQLEVPSQTITVNGQNLLRILASDVPSVGYKTFEIRSGTPASLPNAATVAGGSIENSLYKLVLTGQGRITSLKDKARADREFVGSGAALNELGTGADAGTLVVENQGAVSVTLKASSTSPLAHDTRITLFRNINRIDISNQINVNFSNVQTWRFAFNLTAPDLNHEEVGAVIRARYADQGGHYSRTSARYDWLTINHFADLSGAGNVGVTLSNADLYFMRLGNSGGPNLDTSTPEIKLLAGGQVDGNTFGVPSQGGDSSFLQRFALTTHDAYNQRDAMKFSLEHQNPLVAGVISGGSQYPGTNFSLVNVSGSNALLWALKPADDGISEGLVARLWNQAVTPVTAALSVPAGSISSAKNITHVETALGALATTSGALGVDLTAQQLKSISFIPNLSGGPDLTSPQSPSNLRTQ
ncbi:MAG: glycoside hydrolase [Oligoflexia bacterium]|nr:glycoside hydrolase [Oligoflexia bacterium]